MKRHSQMNVQFFRSWSPDMAYVLGVIYADGCLVEHVNGYHGLNITSKDFSWLERLKTTLQAAHKIGAKRRAHQLQIRNQQLYENLLELGLTPRKSKTLQFPAIPAHVFPDFVRGYFDGDGCVTIWQEKRWRHSLQLRTSFTSGSRGFLEALRLALETQAGLKGGSLRFGSRAYCLQYMTGNSLRLYEFMYDGQPDQLCLLRKRKRFEEFIHRKAISTPERRADLVVALA